MNEIGEKQILKDRGKGKSMWISDVRKQKMGSRGHKITEKRGEEEAMNSEKDENKGKEKRRWRRRGRRRHASEQRRERRASGWGPSARTKMAAAACPTWSRCPIQHDVISPRLPPSTVPTLPPPSLPPPRSALHAPLPSVQQTSLFLPA